MRTALLSLLAIALTASAQTSPSGYPAPPPGAPDAACSTDDLPSSTPIRILSGPGPIPFAFACRQHGRPGPCIGGTQEPGTVVSVGPSSGDWSCISAGGISGWVPTARTAPVPDTPQIPTTAWLGWWHQHKEIAGTRSDRLLITRSVTQGELHVSGRAYWYGLNDNVHSGGIDAAATVTGPYLHAVESSNLAGCVLDLKFDPATHTLHAVDNVQCGGMNVRFSGTWTRFTPKPHRTP